MEIDIKSQDQSCYCSKVPIIAHELVQSLVVMNSYVIGCEERIKKQLDSEEIRYSLQKIKDQIEILGNKIHNLIPLG